MHAADAKGIHQVNIQHAVCSPSRGSAAGAGKRGGSLSRPSVKQAATLVSQPGNEAGFSYDIPPPQDLKDIR